MHTRTARAPWSSRELVSGTHCEFCGVAFTADDDVTVINPVSPALAHNTDDCTSGMPDGFKVPFTVEQGRIVELRRKVLVQSAELTRLERSRKAMRRNIRTLQDQMEEAHNILDFWGAPRVIYGFEDARDELSMSARIDMLMDPTRIESPAPVELQLRNGLAKTTAFLNKMHNTATCQKKTCEMCSIIADAQGALLIEVKE